MLVQFENKNGYMHNFYEPDDTHPFYYNEILTSQGMLFIFLIMPHQKSALLDYFNTLKNERDVVGIEILMTKQFKDTPELRKAFGH